MATLNSNLLTPQQAALNNKKSTNPLSKLASAAIKTVGNAILPGAGSAIQLGSAAINAAKPKATPQTVSYSNNMTMLPGTAPKNAALQTPAPAPLKPVSPVQQSAPQQNFSYTPTPAAPQAPTQNTPQESAVNNSLIGRIFEELLARGKQAPTAAAEAAEAAKGSLEVGRRAQEIADTAGQEYASIGKKGAQARTGYLTTGTTPVAEGNAAIVAQNQAAQQTAIATGAQTQLLGIDKQLTAQNQAATGLNNAASTAQGALNIGAGVAAPVQQPYGNMLVDPVTGQPIQQNGASGNVNDAVSLQVQRVMNGTSSYDQAAQALQAYGQAGVNALQQALGPNFDIAQSNANAAAKAQALGTNVTQGVAAERAMNSATAALDKLDTELTKLSPIYKGGVPLTNAIASDIANFLGQNAVSQYQSTLNDARQQVAAVLTAIGASTPTDAMSSARGYLPDGMTPAQQTEKVKAVKELMQQKVDAYKTTGGVPQYNPTGGNAPTTGFTW